MEGRPLGALENHRRRSLEAREQRKEGMCYECKGKVAEQLLLASGGYLGRRPWL